VQTVLYDGQEIQESSTIVDIPAFSTNSVTAVTIVVISITMHLAAQKNENTPSAMRQITLDNVSTSVQ